MVELTDYDIEQIAVFLGDFGLVLIFIGWGIAFVRAGIKDKDRNRSDRTAGRRARDAAGHDAAMVAATERKP